MRLMIRPVQVIALLVLGLCLMGAAKPDSSTPSLAVRRPQKLVPFVLPWDDGSPGPTDLSALLKAPAGKDGPIRVGPRGHLIDGQGKRIRFFGVNLAGRACFLSQAAAKATAGRLAKFGVNIVRLHHMDAAWAPGENIFGPHAKNTRRLDPGQLGRLDSLIAQLKQRGIYTDLNLLVGRPFCAADGLPPQIESVSWKLRHIIAMFDPRMIQLQKEYAAELLGHRNPYTGLTYAKDPATQLDDGYFSRWYSIVQHPTVMANVPVASLMFRRFDVQPARQVVIRRLTAQTEPSPATEGQYGPSSKNHLL